VWHPFTKGLFHINIHTIITLLHLMLNTVQPEEPHCLRVRVMVFNAAFNNISVISWQSVLLVEETRVPEENR
jgi:hypothetical protein